MVVTFLYRSFDASLMHMRTHISACNYPCANKKGVIILCDVTMTAEKENKHVPGDYSARKLSRSFFFIENNNDDDGRRFHNYKLGGNYSNY